MDRKLITTAEADWCWCKTDGNGQFRFLQLKTESDENYILIENEIEIPEAPNHIAELEAAIAALGFNSWQTMRDVYDAEQAKYALAEYVCELRGVEKADAVRHFQNQTVAQTFCNLYMSLRPFYEAYKNCSAFFLAHGDSICYIPEHSENINDCFTYNDYLELCGGDSLKAWEVFNLCEWQSPHTVLQEWDEEDEEALNQMKSARKDRGKCFILLHLNDHEDSPIPDVECFGLFANRKEAYAEMKLQYEAALSSDYDPDSLDSDCTGLEETGASIRTKCTQSVEQWSICEKEMPKISISIVVDGGVVDEVYSENPNLKVELLDFDDAESSDEDVLPEYRDRIAELAKTAFNVL